MSDEKSLSDDLNDMLGDAKEGAKKAADKAEEMAGKAKEKAKELASEAKEAASEFTEDAKEALSDGKNIAIIAHLTIIGWVIALLMNNNKKTELGSFYIRQVLGIIILGFLSWIPLIGLLVAILVFVLWLTSFIGAISGKTKPVFLLGDKFQEWFKSL